MRTPSRTLVTVAMGRRTKTDCPAAADFGQRAGVGAGARDDVGVEAVDDALEGDVVEVGLDVRAKLGGGEQRGHQLGVGLGPVAGAAAD